jgi:tripartite-type tricarboxylate transporter receptor subunit TctC
MTLPRRQFLHLTAGVVAFPAVARIAKAQAWPARVVRLLVGFPPGGGADATTRIVASRLSEMWGQQVVVENKPGVGGNIALDTAAHATPDGYTMVLAVVAPAIYGFLLGRSITIRWPISRGVADRHLPNILVVRTPRVQDRPRLHRRRQAGPGKVTFAAHRASELRDISPASC